MSTNLASSRSIRTLDRMTCVSVCVCMRKREREKEKKRNLIRKENSCLSEKMFPIARIEH